MNVNGLNWKIVFTENENDLVVNGSVRLGVTDRNNLTVYLYDNLYGKLLRKVLIHELTHVWLFSYGYNLDVEFEEMLCSFVDTYARDILDVAESLENKGFEKNFKKVIDREN